MLIDFDAPERPEIAHAEVCIVGAGAAGVAIATELAKAGRSVVLLEGGGPEQEDRSQELYRSAVTGQPHRGIHEGRFRTYGGTTTRWGGQILELQDEDFERRAWVDGSGWPFPKSELTSHYERALHYFGLRRVERDDEAVWLDLGLDRADVPRDLLSPELRMLFSRWLPERNVAELHARTLTGSRRIHVVLHASVTALNLNDAATAVSSLTVRGFSGRRTQVIADQFVLCLGGIETTRLLLQPTAAQLPWQANGLLGKHYQDHICVNGISVKALRVREPWRLFGYTTTRGFRFHNKLWLRPDEQQRLRTLNVAGTVNPMSPEDPRVDRALQWLREIIRTKRIPQVGEALRQSPFVARILADRLSEHYRGEAPKWKEIMLAVHAEQSPAGRSQIRLCSERDELGLLRTELDWQISDAELHTVREYTRVATEVFARTGLGKISAPRGFFTDDTVLRSFCGDSFHHMGGTRMSTTPADGVVAPDLRLHGIGNAYVCSASVFPTSGFSNPTHTVLALSMRLADKLAGQSIPLATVPRPMREITLSGSDARTTQLGFGCAYLLGPGIDAAKSRRLLDAAWDAGIRHFDAARLYGLGQTESLLGPFLKEHPDATVTTKFGVIPPNALQKNLIRAGRFLPALNRILPERNDKSIFRAADAQAALETSLCALGRESVELFLLHEATAADLTHPDLLDWLLRKREAGVIGNFGFGGEYANIPALLAERPEYVPVLQFENSLLSPQVATGNAWCAYYRTFAPAARRVTALLDANPALIRTWSETVGLDLSEPETASRLMLKAALETWPGALQLFSTGSEAHIFTNAEVAGDSTLARPAGKLAALVAAAL